MKARIAIATVHGKAYYLLVDELKRKNMPFLSLTPNEAVPIGIEVVITTEEEKRLINHKRILVYKEDLPLELLINEASKIASGKEFFEKVIVGVDPGDIFGIAVIADGKVLETANCRSVKDTLNKIESMIKSLGIIHEACVSVKVGDGVISHKENLLRVLDKALPSSIVLESVSEAGTSQYSNETKHRRGLRDIVSAMQIAGRSGQKFQRRKTGEPNS
jgi:hypothetical protein